MVVVELELVEIVLHDPQVVLEAIDFILQLDVLVGELF